MNVFEDLFKHLKVIRNQKSGPKAESETTKRETKKSSKPESKETQSESEAGTKTESTLSSKKTETTESKTDIIQIETEKTSTEDEERKKTRN